jgi:serine/threonine-protein kinase RsbW
MATLTLPAQPTLMTLGTAFVANHAIAEGLPPKRVAEIELAVEEALVNICHYAYRNKAGNVEVRCTRDGPHQFRIELIDAGEPFNILTLPPPDPTANLDLRPVGGLGILLIRSLVENVAYRREGNRNILQLVVRPPH